MGTVLAEFGIVEAFPELRVEDVTPEACMKSAADSLWFMGYHGRKWIGEPWFRRHLARLHRHRTADVKFLLATGASDSEIETLAALLDDFGGIFEVRISPEPPVFRLVIIDKTHLVLAHYGHEVIDAQGANAAGWSSPQLIVKHGPEWSLIIPFMMLYRRLWDRSTSLADFIDEKNASASPKSEPDDSTEGRTHRGFR
jgi:hypothetical protein